MTIKDASAKANMSYAAGRRYYNKYLKDPNHNIPVRQLQQNYTQDQKNEFIRYIINDKMSIKAASKKAKMNETTDYGCYHKYFKEENPGIARSNHIRTNNCYTQEQIKEVIGYIVDNKMSITVASKKAHMNRHSSARYYLQYLNDNNIKLPVARKTYLQDDINKLIGHIVNDKMTLTAASKKANMAYSSGYKYYRQYLLKKKSSIS
jgi:hypothetical protein